MLAPAETPTPSSGSEDLRRMRNAAIRGVLVASVAIGIGLMARNQSEPWLILAVVVALGASVLTEVVLARRLLKQRVRQQNLPHRPGVADTLLAQIPDPVILVDGRSIVVEANAAARHLLPGLKVAEPL